MVDMDDPIILQIQNSRKPEEIVSVVLGQSSAHLETRGLKRLFDLEEIMIERNEFLQDMEEFAVLLSFLIENMSAAKDFSLPYSYSDDFEHRGRRYSMMKENGFRVLKRETF